MNLAWLTLYFVIQLEKKNAATISNIILFLKKEISLPCMAKKLEGDAIFVNNMKIVDEMIYMNLKDLKV